MRTKLIITVLSVLVLTGLTTGPSAAAESTAKNRPQVAAASFAPAALVGRFRVYNNYSGRCLDADPASLNRNGTTVRLWDCNSLAQNQLWNVHLIDNYYVFENFASRRVLDADPISMWRNGTTVRLWQYNGGLNQKWTGWSDSFGYGFSNASSPYRTLDADLVTIWRNGTTVQLWDYGWGATQQQWTLEWA